MATSFDPEPTSSFLKFDDWLRRPETSTKFDTLRVDSLLGKSAPAEDYHRPVKEYGNYVRQSLLSSNKYSGVDSESEIRQGMANILSYYGAVEKTGTDEDFNKALDKTGIFMDDELDTETLIGLARKSGNLTKEESDILSEYTAFKDVIAARDEAVSYEYSELKKQGFEDGVDDKFSILKAEAEKIVANPLFQNKVKRDLVSQGDYSMAEVYREQDGKVVLGNDGQPIKDLFFPRSVPQEQINAEINKAYSSGLLNAGTATQAFRYITPSENLKVNGVGVSEVDIMRSAELGGVITQTLIDKPYLQNSFDKLKEKLAGDQYLKADEDKTLVENILSPIDAVNDLYNESQASKKSKQDVDEVYEWVAFNLNRSGILDSGDSVTIEEIKPIVDKIALHRAYNDGTVRFSEIDETNPKKAASNIGVAPDGTVIVHPLLNKSDFEAALEAKKDELNPDQVDQARTSREEMLIKRAPETAKLLASQMGDKFIKFQAEALDSGKSQKDAVEEFLDNRDNFSEFKTRATGVGASIGDSVVGALATIPALMGNEKARDYFINYSKKQQERSSVANLFGVEFGIEQDIAQGIAPVIVDGLVTLGLSATTGLGGAAYLAARAGTKMTVKGLMTAALGKGLRETAEMSAEKLLMKESLDGAFRKSVSPEEAIGLIKQYNTAINSSWVKSPIYFLPTANRVAGMSYSSTYATLSEMKKPDGSPMYTPEEVRKGALSSSLITAGSSAIITSAFSVLGKAGGVEELFMAGANKKQMLSAINQFADTSGITAKINGRITEKSFKEFTAKRLKETIKENGLNGIASQSRLMAGVAGGVKMGVEEFPEEALDQFVSGIIETSFTGEDKPLFDRMAEAMHAGLVGLAIGGGLGGIKATGNQFSKGSQRATQLAQRQIETDFVNKVTSDLRNSGSPITADIVDAIMRKSSGRTGIRVGDKTVSAGDLLAATLNQPTGPTPTPAAPTAAAPTAAAPTPTPVAAATPTPTPVAADATPRRARPSGPFGVELGRMRFSPWDATKPTVPEATVEQAGEILKAIAEHPDNFASKVVATGTDDIPQAKTFNNQKLNQKKVAAAVEQGQMTSPKPKGGKAAKPRENVVKRASVDEKAVAERIAETTPKPPRKVTKQQVKQETESPSDNSNTNTVVDEDEVVDAADAAVEVEITQDKLNDLQILWGDVNSIIENFRGSELDPDDVGDILAISTDINEIFPGIPEDIASIPTDPKELFDWVVDFDIWLGQQKTQVEVAAAPTKAAPTKAAPTKTAPAAAAPAAAAPTKAAPTKAAPTKAAPAAAAPAAAAPAAAAPTKAAPSKAAPTKAAPTKAAPTKAAPTKAAPKKKRDKTPKPGDVVDESGKVVEPTLDEQIGDFLIDNSLVSKEEDFDVSIAAIKKVVIEGYPVTFSRNSQYGLQGFSFVGGNSKKLTSFVHELIDQQYPKRPLPDDRTGFTTKVLKDGKNKRTVYFQDDIPFFDNDPVTVRLLIANGHTVVIPPMFWGDLNRAIKRGTYSGVAHAIKVLRLKTSGTESEVVATTLKTVPVGLAHYDSKTAEYWRGVFDLFWTKESSSESVESEISEERVRLFYTGMVDSTSIKTYLNQSIAYVQGKRMPNASNFLVVNGDPRLFTQAQNEIIQEAHGRAAQALVRSKLKDNVTKKDNKWVIDNKGAVTTFKKFLTSIGKNPNEVADRLRKLLNETSPKNDTIFEKYISSLFKGLNSAGLTDTDSIDKISDRVIRRTLQFIDTKKIREAASLSTSLDNFNSFGNAPVDTVGEGGDLTRMSFEEYYSERREFTAGGPLPGEEDVFDEILNFSPIFVESGTLGLGVQPIEEPNYIRLNTPTGGPTQPVDYGRGRVYAVSGIVDGSPAAGALNFGDIIVEIDGTPTANIYAYDIPDKLTFGTPGAEVKMQVIRFDSETNSFASGSVPVVLKRATQSAVSKENTPQGTSDYSNLGYKEINGVLDGISNVVRKTVDTFPDLKTGLIDVYRAFAQTDETYEQLRDRTADEILGASMNIYSAIGSDKTISDYLLYSDDNPVTDEALRAAAFLKSLRGPDESLPKHLLLFRNYLRVMYNFQSKYADAPLTDYEQALLIKPVKELFAEEGMQLNEDNFNSIVKVLSNRLGNVFGARMQERLAKNFARTKEQRDAAEARNTEEANDLGLANGDPESVITALNRIVADNDYPLYLRTTARALLRSPDLIRSTKINIFSNNFDFAGKFGTDINGNYVVSLNLRGSNGKSLASVLTHEYLHALTHNALNDPRFANNAKVTELKRTYEELKNLVDEKGLDDPELLAGMESVDEFVAYMFTSQSFQNAVKRVGFSESKGFFKRILDTILDIFGIRAALRQSEIYTQMVDLVYYAPNTEPLTMGRLNSDLAQSVAEAAAEAAENATAVGNMTRPGTVIPAPNAQATPVVAGDPNLVQDPRDTERQKELARTVVARIRNLGSIPAEVPVVVDYNLPQAMGADIETGRIIINPEKVAIDFISLTQDDAEVDAALEIALDEELTHVADLTTIPQEEFDKFANLVPDSDLEEAGVKYFNDPTYTLPDPATDPDKYTTERNLLVSERLRQNVQGILLGQSTEDMFLFLSRNKANKEVTNFAEAYFKRVVAGYTMKRKLRKFSARERALLTRLINERRRLALNYRSPNPHLIAGLSGEALVNEVDKFLAQHESKVNPNPPEQEKPAEDPTKFDQQNNRYTMEDETFVQPADNTKLSGAFRTSFNLPLLTDKVKEMGNLLSNGRTDEAYAMAETAVAHMLSDIPTAKYTFKVQRIRGAWEDQSQASLAMTFGTDSEETLVAIRNRMNALGLAFNQDEIHELEVLAPLPEGADYEIGVIDSDGSQVQPMITVKLKESVPGAAIETYRRTSGVRGMSYDEKSKEIVFYNIDDAPEDFVNKTLSTIKNIKNDFPTAKPRYTQSNVRIRRSGNATDEGRGILAYEENYVPDSNAYGRDSADEFFAARNAFVRSILNTTGGRLTSPISGPQMAVYKRIALTPENTAKLYDTATDFDNLPLDGSSNPMVLKAYEALVKDLDRAYKSIINKKLKIQLTDSKPYGSQADLMADLTAGVLKIQRTNANSFTTPDIAAKHPLLRNSNYTGMLIGSDGTDTVEATLLNNDMLRVLQTFATYGVSGPVSQEGSFQFMAAMLRQPEAVWALSGEIRGQHAWHTYGPDARGANGDMLRPNEVGYIREPNRRWSEQKLALLPIKDADTGNSVIDDKLRKFAKGLSESEKNGSLDQQPAPAPTPTVLGMAYIGPRAELNQFKRDSLQTAQMMAASGKSSEEIRTTTGWSPNPYDGKLRWEIPDNDAGFVGLDQYREVTNRVYNAEVFRRLPIEYAAEQIKAGKFVRLSEVFNHPAIYEAYPDAANIAFFPLGGNVAQGSIRTLSGETMITASVVLDNDRISDESTSTIIHELQHFIQRREGFTPGGSPDTLVTTGDLAKSSEFNRGYGKILRYEKDIARQVDAIAEERSKKGFLGVGGPSSKKIKLKEEIISDIQKSVNEIWKGLNNGLGLDNDSVRVAIFKAFFRVENELGSVWYLNNRNKGLHMVYRLLAGEVEARDVEARRTFTPEQRAATAPYSSENISPEDAIILPPTVIPAPSASRFAQDAEYLALAADPVKNQARLQEMADAAAKAAGYVVGVFHGTSSPKDFTKFRSPLTGIWTAYDEKAADPLEGDRTKVFKLYANPGNFPIELTKEDYKEWQMSISPRAWVKNLRWEYMRRGYKSTDPENIYNVTSVKVSDYALVLFNPEQVKSADPVTYDKQGNVIPLSQRFDTTKTSILYAPSASRFGSASGIPNAVAADTTDYSGFTELFTMPAFEVGTYKSPATYMGKVLKGSYDSRIRRLLNMNKSLERAGLDLMTRFKKRLDLIIKREFDGDPSSVISVLNRASGTTEATFSNDAWNAINDKYDKQIEETGTPTRPYDPVEYNDMVTALTMMNPTASATTIERMANRELYSMEINRIEATRTAEINAERKKIGDAVRADRDAAFMELRAISPNLAKAVADLRQIIDEISRKASKETGIKNPALSVIIEDNLGIYVTRAYKFFEDAGYADIIMRPDAQASSAVDPAVIDAADDYFRNEFLKQEVRRIRKSDLTLTKSEAEAEAEYRYRTSTQKHGMSPAVAARIEFLSQYRPGGSSDRMAVNPDVIDVVDASLKRRGDIPQVLRDLLGERTGEDSVYNLIRTLGVVTRITASQAMVNTIRNIATTGPDKWVYGPDEIGTGDGQFLPGNLWAKGYRPISNKLGGSPFSSLQGYYAPKEFVEAVEESASEASRRSAAAAAERGIQYALGITKYLTGTVMGFKTLWSVAHYGRNIIGQSMMAIHQGRPHLILASAKPLVEELTVVGSRVLPSAIRNALGGLTGDGIDISDEAFAKRLKLIGVGVLEDNVRTNTFRQLVAGQRTIDDVQDEMRMLFAQSNAFEKIKGKVTSVTARLAELEGATEDFMKVAVFRDTLSVLTKARDSGTGSFRGVEFSKMTDNDLDRLAADMTQDTMPAYSRTSPLIRAFTKSNAGDLVAPFIRYWSEMIRVTVTSPMLAVEEMRSGNPVMKMRGFQRMLGSVAAHSISAFAAEAITSWFSDLDDEEEETVREGEAPYLKNHSMAYYREKGVLFKLDFSFLNPLSVVGDPIKAAYDKAIKGDFYGAASAALMTSLEDTILNPQILFGAVKNALENRDSTTGDYLYIEGVDSSREALHKQVSYVVKKIAPTLALTILKIYEAETATGDVEDEYSAEYALRQLIFPARPTPVDEERVLRNIMREKKDQLQQVEGAKYKLTTRKPLNIEYTPEVYREQVEGIRGILSQIYKHGVNLGSLGVPNEILYGEIVEAIGKADTDLLYAGFMRRPEMTQGLADSLLSRDRKGDYGVLRYNAYNEEAYNTPEYLSIK